MKLGEFVRRLPKCELHIHIEGTLEPALMFDIAERNRLSLPFGSFDEVSNAYRFSDLQSFLDIYYQGASVLQTPQDFFDLMSAYLDRAHDDGVRHAEIFFDPQTHTARGVGFETFMRGFGEAIDDARRRNGITADLILCFLRHLSEEDALATLTEGEPHLDRVIAVGLDSSEVGNPPERFEAAYARARSLGLRAVAHAGEEGPPSYVRGALDVLGAERIDHGVRSLEDDLLVSRLAAERVPLTVCPLSNLALRVVGSLDEHPLPEMMDRGLMVSVNSDDPAYFGGYVGANYERAHESLGIGRAGLIELARNSISSSFLSEARKAELVAELSRSEGDQGELA
ncbi:MAG: adenosine deaminase [Acidimicrobiia bacterium]